MSTVRVIGVSIPKDLIQKIDADRGDINRSRYIRRLVETAYVAKESQQIDRHVTT